jgi:hypothetical protein
MVIEIGAVFMERGNIIPPFLKGDKGNSVALILAIYANIVTKEVKRG